MKIETKFERTQKVFLMCDNKVVEGKIATINISICYNIDDHVTREQTKVVFEYVVQTNQGDITTSSVFATKQELLESL